MKKLCAFVLMLAMFSTALFLLGGCNVKEKDNPNTAEFDYEKLYRSERTEPYDAPRQGTTSRASYGYTAKAEQGFNGWYYLFGDNGGYSRMTYDASAGKWTGGGAEMQDEYMRSSARSQAVRAYVADAEGAAVVYGNLRCESASSPSASLSVFVNDKQIYGASIASGDVQGKYFQAETRIKKGDTVYFAVSGSAALNPVVTYENAQEQSLYHLTANGKQYGDVFPWYDEENGKLYMGFLWSDNAALANNYHDALEISDNMLTFTDVPEANNYDVWQRYKENYRMHMLFNTNNFIDTSKYKFGIRDNMLYFDKENNRYLLIAGCYYEFDSLNRTSDLVIYSSDDEYALSWTRQGNVVESGYSHNLPECPSLMKIGDRWYAFVSVAYNTAHQVGPLQYWTGDAGVDCMDVDWSDKQFAFLDGEDLCAARVTNVGGKTYMWGWIPSTYDTMPWAPWAGYLNLPREVVQHSDGSLGGRLDPALSKLLNYGNIYTLSDGNFGVYSGSAQFDGAKLDMYGSDNMVELGGGYSRNYVTFTADMRDSSEISYVMVQGGKQYRVSVVKESGRKYLQVTSPDDTKHKLNSRIEIKSEGDVFDVKLVADGGFLEFFVNDEYALTAHTAMDSGAYSAYLYSDKSAAFSDVRINKLLPYGELQ